MNHDYVSIQCYIYLCTRSSKTRKMPVVYEYEEKMKIKINCTYGVLSNHNIVAPSYLPLKSQFAR